LPDTLEDYLASHVDLLPELPSNNGIRRFPLRLPDLPEGRSFEQAWLELPKAFPENASASIRLSSESVLRIPHIELSGNLCLDDGDPGPLSGAPPIDRIQQLMVAFFELFLRPWCAGELDGDFTKEALNYWLIHCRHHASANDAVCKVYTLDERPDHGRIYSAWYLAVDRIVIAGESEALINRHVASMGQRQQLQRVIVAEVPILYPLIPDTWPKNQSALERLLRARLGDNVTRNFLAAHRARGRLMHRVVILRAPNCSFGFLLPGGPPTIVRRGHSSRSYQTCQMLPLPVERLDLAWVCGRDQNPDIALRQQRKILVIGAGALGSPVIEQLAKSGVGYLTIVDGDSLSAANIGRHVLGADALGKDKAVALAQQLAQRWPNCTFLAEPGPVQRWLQHYNLSDVDIVLDLTGEPDVRLSIEAARKQHSRPLLIGWMEPYVAAAHACLLPAGFPWMTSSIDRLESLQAIEWPDDVLQHEPACSSVFQSYTSAAATHAVALVTEAALDLIDGKVTRPTVRHWIRGQAFLDAHRSGLHLRQWAVKAASFDGVSMETLYE